jgi:hypothetical protein
MINGFRLASEKISRDLAVRPRERKPRLMSVQLGRGRDAEYLYWFLSEIDSAGALP